MVSHFKVKAKLGVFPMKNVNKISSHFKVKIKLGVFPWECQ